MAGSGSRLHSAGGCPIALACLLLAGGCTTDMAGNEAALESALYAPQEQTTGSIVATAEGDDPASLWITPEQATRIALVTTPTTPAPDGRAEELSRAMASMLSAMGYRLVPPPLGPEPDEQIYFVAAQFAIEPDVSGKGEKVGIDWVVSDALGDPVGKISQARTLSRHPTPDQWRTETLLAAAAAAEGIRQLVPVRP